MKTFLILFLVLVLSACSQQIINKENSDLYTIPLGSIFVLHQPLLVTAYHARAYIQYGQLKSEKQVDEYYPHCEVELNHVKPVPQHIFPNRFKVIRVLDDEYEAQRHVLFASLMPVDDGPIFVGFASEYYVQAEKASDVFKITCLHWDDANEERYLTVSEIRQALGSVMSLILKSDSI